MNTLRLLQNPQQRAIADAYVMGMNQALAQYAFPPLYEKHPALQPKLESGKTAILDTYEIFESKFGMALNLVKGLQLAAQVPSLPQGVRMNYRTYLTWIEHVIAYAPVRERFFDRLSQGVSAVAAERSMDQIDVLGEDESQV